MEIKENCSYTCHLECENHVRLDCNQGNGQKEETCSDSPGRTYSTAPPAKNTAKEVEEEKQQSLTEEEVKAKIEEYNSQVTENGMNLAADGTYNGFIKVHMKLRRPVTVLEKDPNSSWNLENSSAEADTSDKRTSFYLPSEALKQLHVSSTTTVREVIEGLLRKYTVQDNPLKFALYKQMHRHGQDLFQKLPDSEYPLLLRLLAGPDLEKLSFVLKENETGEVEWDAFSMPELHNFLAILEKEERERVKQVELRYMTYRKKLINALEEVQNKPG
ncbi:ras association domain-containing protein 5 isoform X3 [Tachysurus vachellii]|uniref:ras association domain-containing protein 5 isoform X3 n=1 Tax=Tachysurus vachellii TaxID=175792 RepID=UPI00296B07D3|nr:ras association domain-containing protein 5 isoform X3 [Tachysurus vachellii]